MVLDQQRILLAHQVAGPPGAGAEREADRDPRDLARAQPVLIAERLHQPDVDDDAEHRRDQATAQPVQPRGRDHRDHGQREHALADPRQQQDERQQIAGRQHPHREQAPHHL